jgi:hypothetical protein
MSAMVTIAMVTNEEIPDFTGIGRRVASHQSNIG